LAIDRERGDRAQTPWTLHNVGISAYHMGDHAAARACLEESLAIGRELGLRPIMAFSLHDLGVVATAEGNYRAGRALCQEGLVIRRGKGAGFNMAGSLEAIAATFSLTIPSKAARLWGRAKRLRDEVGSPVPPFWRPRYEQQIAAARAALGDGVA